MKKSPLALSFISLLATLLVAPAALSAPNYVSPEMVIQKATQVRIRVRQTAYSLSGFELERLNRQLDRILLGQYDDRGPGPGYPDGPGGGLPPGPGPGRPGPGRPGGHLPRAECKVLGVGSHNGWNYTHRLAVNGVTMEGSNSLDQILQHLARYETDQICIRAYPEACELLGVGSYNGWNYNYRVKVGQAILAGSNSYQEAISAMNKLSAAGVCFR